MPEDIHLREGPAMNSPRLLPAPSTSSPGRRVRLAAAGAGCLLAAATLAVPTGAARAATVPPSAPNPPRYTVTDRFSIGSMTAGSTTTVIANCNQGEERIGGGFSIGTLTYRDPLPRGEPRDRYPIEINAPSVGEGWTLRVRNRGDHNELAVAHVVCASKQIGTVVTWGAPGAPTVRCPKGTVVTAGGWNVGGVSQDSDVTAIQHSNRSGYDGWYVMTRPADGSTAKPDAVSVATVCVVEATPVPTVGNDTWVAVGYEGITGVRSATDRCPEGGIAAAMGFSFGPYNRGQLGVTALAPPKTADLSTWGFTGAAISNGYEVPGDAVTYMPCFTVPRRLPGAPVISAGA
jgi:hypothetical protein